MKNITCLGIAAITAAVTFVSTVEWTSATFLGREARQVRIYESDGHGNIGREITSTPLIARADNAKAFAKRDVMFYNIADNRHAVGFVCKFNPAGNEGMYLTSIIPVYDRQWCDRIEYQK